MLCCSSSITKLTPSKAVRAYCIHCLGLQQFNADEVENCTGAVMKCPFFSYRLGKRPSVKIFRSFCIDCMGGRSDMVKDCPTVSCHAYRYRMGTNPARHGIRKNIRQTDREPGFERQISIFSGQDVGSIVPA